MTMNPLALRSLTVLAIAGAAAAALCFVLPHRAAASPTAAEGAASGAAAAATPPEPNAGVQTVDAHRGPIAKLVHAYGSVSFATADQTTISLPYAAQLTRLAVAAGQTVRQGALLAEMSADPAVTAAFVQARSTLQAAGEEMTRTRSLYDKQLATQSQLAAAQKALGDARTAVDELTRQGATPGARKLVAPFDGTVIAVSAAQGDRVAAAAPLLQLGRSGATGRAHIGLGLDPAAAAQVAVGDVAQVTPLAGSAAEAPASYAGKVSAVRQAVNGATHLVDAAIELDPAAGAPLLPGMPVSARIEVGRPVHWVVPRSAVLNDEHGDYLFQVADGRAHRVAVVRRVESGASYGVDGALDAGRPVVSLGNYELSDGMAVHAAAAGARAVAEAQP